MRQAGPQSPLLWTIYLLFWICGIFAAIWPMPALAAAGIILFADERLRRFSRVLFCFFLCLAAFALAHWQIYRFHKAVDAAPGWAQNSSGRKTAIEAKIFDIQYLPDGRLRILLEGMRPAPDKDGLAEDDSRPSLPGLCQWTWVEPPAWANPLPGQMVRVNRSIRQIRGNSNDPGLYYETRMAAQGIYWRMWSRGEDGNPLIFGRPSFPAAARENLRKLFLAALASGEADNHSPLPQDKAILLALLFGDRSEINRETVENFAAATLAHSLALSGQHLCLAGFLALMALLGMARLKPDIYLHRPKLVLLSLASLPLALLYLWLGNAPASLVRAFCMLLILALLLWRGSAFSLIDLLSAALFLILIFRPLAILDTGLQLSALCVAAISLAMPALKKLAPAKSASKLNIHTAILGRLAQILLVSFIIQLTLLPISLARFQVAGFWFPLNVFWLPVLGFFVLPLAALGLALAAASSLIGMEAARLTLDLAAIPTKFLLEKLASLREIGFLAEPAFLLPNWPYILAFAILACGLARVFGAGPAKAQNSGMRRAFLLALVLLALPPAMRLQKYFSRNIEIEALDVGQGMAIHMRFPDGMRLLLDGGGSAFSTFNTGKAILAPRLAENSPPRLSAVINSHPDMDHLGGLFYILRNFQVDRLFHNGRQAIKNVEPAWKEIQRTKQAIILREGDRIALGNPQNELFLEVLHPPKESGPKEDWRGNDASLVFRLTRKGAGLALFTGDAELDALKKLARGAYDLRAKVLFLPHHGSSGSFLPALYKAVRPDLAVASCGFKNRWHYPGKKIVDYFYSKGIPLLDTGNRGRISLVFGESGQFAAKTIR